MYIQSFEQFNQEIAITEKLIEFLHEGIKLVPINSSLNESSNVKSFAQKEIELVVRHARNKGDQALIEEFAPEMLALIDKFGNSGQSGGSAPYTAGAIVEALKKLLLFKPIAPIMNEDEEWGDTGFGSEGMLQNKRCYSLFKEHKDADPYYLDAIVWKTPSGGTFTGSAFLGEERIRSRQYIKEFPFEPKTFIIDVDEKEIAPDDWEFHIKDPKQMDEVFTYYKKYSK